MGARFHALIQHLADRWCEPGSPHELRHPEVRPLPPSLRLEVDGGAWVIDSRSARPRLTAEGAA